MRVFRLAVLTGVTCGLALVLAACGSSKEEAAPGAAQAPASSEAATPAGDAAKAAGGLGDLARSMEEASKGLAALAGDGRTVEPVSFRELQKFFPAYGGWEMGQPEGEKMTSPVSFSQSEVEYVKGEARIEARIVDSGLNQIIFAPFMMFLVQGYEKETSSGYEKSLTVAGAPGFERWDTGEKSGELTLVVGKRYLVELKGHGIGDANVLHEFAAKMDLSGLSALK